HACSTAPRWYSMRNLSSFERLLMKYDTRVKQTCQPETYGLEVRIANCLSVKGCRLAVYEEAERRGARRVAGKDAILSVDGGLVINLGFQDR
ncbi:unnamed protein product, partial [Ectocarpus fasciculatus]